MASTTAPGRGGRFSDRSCCASRTTSTSVFTTPPSAGRDRRRRQHLPPLPAQALRIGTAHRLAVHQMPSPRPGQAGSAGPTACRAPDLCDRLPVRVRGPQRLQPRLQAGLRGQPQRATRRIARHGGSRADHLQLARPWLGTLRIRHTQCAGGEKVRICPCRSGGAGPGRGMPGPAPIPAGGRRGPYQSRPRDAGTRTKDCDRRGGCQPAACLISDATASGWDT